jgi:hypothetical protein
LKTAILNVVNFADARACHVGENSWREAPRHSYQQDGRSNRQLGCQEVHINHRQILDFFLDIKKDGADLVCHGLGNHKNNFLKILCQESIR